MAQSHHAFLGRLEDLPATRRAGGILLVLCLVSFYLQLHLGVPFAVHYLLGMALFFVLIPQPAAIRLWGTIGLVTGASIFWFAFSPAFDTYLTEQMISLIQLLLAILAFLGVVRALRAVRPRRLQSVSYWLFVCMSLGILLEVLGPLRPVSDAVREVLYSHGFYSGFERDLRTFGWIRPKLFASEPSHLGKFYGLATFAAIATSQGTGRKVRILLASLPVVVMISSPAALPGLIVSLAVIVQSIGLRRVLSNPLMVVLLVFVSVGILYEVVDTIQTRIIQSLDPSLYLRLVRPVELVIRTMQERPFLGYGIGSDRQIAWLFAELSTAANVPAYVRNEIGMTNRVWGAAHFALLCQLGLLGSAVWMLALAQYVGSQINRMLPVFWVFYAVFGFFIGAINTPFYWGQMAIVLGLLIHAERQSVGRPAPQQSAPTAWRGASSLNGAAT